ncbi:O-antigen ligase family protein [Ruminococcus bromii]|uniref:O-antigen ligase family protein n=1 Tax=Ruminococcus bromii TaxID=40518 RepID=UPI0039F5B2ED
MGKIKEFLSDTYAAEWILLLSLVLSGGFNEYVGCVLSAIISVLLIVKIAQNRNLVVNINITSLSIAVITLLYLISCFYAIDSGMAFVGFLKFLPVLLYMLLLMQDKGIKEHLIALLPYVALALGVLSLVLMYIPITKDYFTVSDRLAGFFQYPNTFALFLLVGELTALSKEKLKPIDIISALLLIILLLFTGSRAVFILAVFSNVLIIFFRKGKKVKILLGIVVAVLAVAVLLMLPLFNNSEIFSRYFTISFSESTFIGRLLYYFDAFPLILRHPFGLGYMGYYYVQQSIQTGVYSVMFIHNDFLQLLLDVGWIPCLLFVVGIIKSFFRKGNSAGKRIILLTVFLHCLFDFDLQFISMFFILLLFLNYNDGKQFELKKGAVFVFSFVITGLLSLYFAVALGLAHFGFNQAADSMFPGNTQNKVDLLIAEDDIVAQNEIADRIISQNEYVQIAYSAKARYAFSQGDFESLISYKNKIFQIAPFSYDEYEDYCYMLIQGIQLYKQAGDEYSTEVCEQQLLKTADRLDRLDDKLSNLGRKIVDQPKTDLPDDIVKYINSLES